jgi:DtxR family Mn-dependent transcriptional regulator
MEDYLKAALVIKQRGDRITVTALSDAIGVKRPSVDWALNKLGEAGLVTHEKYGDVELTPAGAKIAAEVNRRHIALYTFLTEILNIKKDTALKEACRMEHALSRDSLNRLEKFINFVLEFHPGLSDWEEIFNRFIEYGEKDSLVQARFSKMM